MYPASDIWLKNSGQLSVIRGPANKLNTVGAELRSDDERGFLLHVDEGITVTTNRKVCDAVIVREEFLRTPNEILDREIFDLIFGSSNSCRIRNLPEVD